MNARLLRAGAMLLLVALAPCALAQRAPTQSIAIGEPDPTAPRLPAHPARQPQSQPQVDATFKAWDLDGNGSLSIAEFRVGYFGLRRAGEMQEHLRHQFGAVDLDKSGAIDASEYGNLLLIKNAGKTAPPLSMFDTNKNQRLEFGEYIGLVQRMAARQTPPPAAPDRKP